MKVLLLLLVLVAGCSEGRSDGIGAEYAFNCQYVDRLFIRCTNIESVCYYRNGEPDMSCFKR